MITRKEILNRTLKAANDLRAIAKDSRENNVCEDLRYSIDRKADELMTELLKQEGVELLVK